MEYLFTEESPRVLVVDDEKVIREILSDFLSMEGFVVRTAEDGLRALGEMDRRSFNVVITDLMMPNMGGLELLRRVGRQFPETVCVIMTGYGTVETAIEAMKVGAYDYILKPFKIEEVIHVIRRGIEKQRLQRENVQLREALSLYHLSQAIAESLSLDHVLQTIVEAAQKETDADLVSLVLAEERTGDLAATTQRTGSRVPPEVRPDTTVVDLKALTTEHGEGRPVLFQQRRSEQGTPTGRFGDLLVSFMSVPLRSRNRLQGMLNVFSFTGGRHFSEGQRKTLAILAERASSSLENAQLYANLQDAFRQTLQGFAKAIEAKDPYTRGHSDRVAEFARRISVGLGLRDEDVQLTYQSALMHDIGKLGIEHDAMNKPGKLTDEEYEEFKKHPAIGAQILEPVVSMRDLVPGVLHHHERYDGNGYPSGLAGDQIPLMGRIVAVADTYDAMTSDRSYRAAMSHEAAVTEIRRCAGGQFDPTVAAVFLHLLEDQRSRRSR